MGVKINMNTIKMNVVIVPNCKWHSAVSLELNEGQSDQKYIYSSSISSHGQYSEVLANHLMTKLRALFYFYFIFFCYIYF